MLTMEQKLQQYKLVIEDIRPHINAWIALLTTHVANLPPDTQPTAESEGCADRSYAEHELHAMQRDLQALAALNTTVDVAPHILLKLPAKLTPDDVADLITVYFNGRLRGIQEHYGKSRMLDEYKAHGVWRLEPFGQFWLTTIDAETVSVLYRNTDNPDVIFKDIAALPMLTED